MILPTLETVLAAEMSFVLTVVNLLPVLPLDGGRALACVLRRFRGGARMMAVVRRAVLLLLLVCGIYCAAAGWGFAPLLLAFWLGVVPSYSCKKALNDVKYSYY
jgi:Zn-dependent protease